jgi:hypothetical protein
MDNYNSKPSYGGLSKPSGLVRKQPGSSEAVVKGKKSETISTQRPVAATSSSRGYA